MAGKLLRELNHYGAVKTSQKWWKVHFLASHCWRFILLVKETCQNEILLMLASGCSAWWEILCFCEGWRRVTRGKRKKKILGVPTVARWVKNPTAVALVTAEAWVQSPALCSELKNPLLRQLQLTFSPWPGHFRWLQVWP